MQRNENAVTQEHATTVLPCCLNLKRDCCVQHVFLCFESFSLVFCALPKQYIRLRAAGLRYRGLFYFIFF